MTGAEIVGAGVAAAKGAKKVVDALGGDAKEQEQLSRLAEDTRALEVAANARADRVAIRQLVLTKLYAPLAKWVGYKSDYFEGQFADDMAEKLADVPEEHITSPSPVVAAQSIEGLSYPLDEPGLREMYLNLLATASDARIATLAHPSFAQIIKQLAPREAGLLELAFDYIARVGVLPIVELRSARAAISYAPIHRHVVNLTDSASGEPVEEWGYSAFVDNWVRLGLVTVEYGQAVSREGAYDWVDARPELARLKSSLKGNDEYRAEYERGYLQATDFGRSFVRAVGSNAGRLPIRSLPIIR